MLLAVLGYSMAPLVVAVAGGDSPFLFNAAWRLGLVVGFASFGILLYRNVLTSIEARRHIVNRLRSPAILAAVFSNNDYAFFVLAATLVHVSAATVVFETWPLWMILMLAFAYRKIGRYRRNLRLTTSMVLLCLVGLCFMVGSQSGTIFGNVDEQQSSTAVLGSILALVGALVGSFAAFSFKWSTDVSEELSEFEALSGVGAQFGEAGRQRFLELLCLIVAYGVSSSISVLVSLVVGIARGEYMPFNLQVMAFLGGVVTYAPATIAWRMGNLQTTNLGVNAVIYGTPVLSLFWLFLLSLATAPILIAIFDFNIVRPDYLVIGLISIVVANLLINFEAEVRFGFKALILSMWAFGAFVYLRDDLLNLLPFETWLWPGDTYPEALGLSATIFILLLSFRVARMSERTQDEDNRILELFQSLDLLVRRNVIDRAVRDHLIELDDARTPAELQSSYNKAKLCFAEAVAAGPDARNLARLGAAETQLNIIVHSRQQGIELGELFALLIFGGSTILIGILSRPPLTGWIGFLVEILAALFSAVIVFLIINVWDLHRERANLILKKRDESDDYGLIFSNPRSRRFEQSMSVIIGLAITVAYAALLWQKWLP